jgi:hypothetical protein
MDKLEIKQGSFIQQTQYFIPVEIYLLTIMSSTIYMYISVHKKNPIKIGEGKNEYVLTHTWFSGGKIQYILIFPGGKSQYILIFPGRKMSMGVLELHLEER